LNQSILTGFRKGGFIPSQKALLYNCMTGKDLDRVLVQKQAQGTT